MSSRSHAMKSMKTHFTATTGTSEFSYPLSVADMMTTKPSSSSQRTQATDPSSSIPSTSMRSSMSSHAFGTSGAAVEDIVAPLPENPYCFEESENEDEREKKSSKKRKKKKKSKKHEKQNRRSSNESSERQSSRRTMESSFDSHHKSRSSSDRQSSRRTADPSDRRRRKDLEPLDETLVSPREEQREHKVDQESEFADEYIVSPRKERRERRPREVKEFDHHKFLSPQKEYRRWSNDDDHDVATSDEFLRTRRERHERIRDEGLEVSTIERKGRRERLEQRTRDKVSSHHKHRRASSVGGSHSHRHHGSSTHRHPCSEAPLKQPGHPRDLPYPGEIFLEDISVEHDKSRPSGPAEMWSPPSSQGIEIPTMIEIPTSIDVVSERPAMEKPKRERKSRLPKTDFDRLRQLLHEQSERSDSDSESSHKNAMVLDKLHPLISAADEDFQEAFDNLAKDSVFDDNFEKAFNEFSEHYLALSPWGEDDSTGMKDQCDMATDQDFLQIPLTPVSKKEINSYISKDKKRYCRGESESDDVVRTPVLERGVLAVHDLDDHKHEDSKKKMIEPTAQEMVEVSRTSYFRKMTSSPVPSPEEYPEHDDKVTDLVHKTSDHSSSRARSEPSPRHGAMRKLFRGKRQTSKATV